jgi:hypothetical protein
MGGLGNQLFQYAAGRRLALLHDCLLVLDLGWFDRVPAGDTARRFELAPLAIEARPASKRQVATTLGRWRLTRLFARAQASKPWYARRAVFERLPFATDPDFERITPPAHLTGYWQSPGYCEPIRDQLLREIVPRSQLSENAKAIASRIESAASAAIHVRRGDYAHNPRVRSFHGLCSPAYYRAAVRELSERVAPSSWFVFSDDPEWCRENLDLGIELEVVSGNPSYEDLYLMSQCSHHVLANSSFSWWGAWLCTRPGQVVVAPRRWVRDPSLEGRSPALPSWILL